MNPNAKSIFSSNYNYNYNYNYNKNLNTMSNLNIMEVYINPITKQKVIFKENVVNKPHTKPKN